MHEFITVAYGSDSTLGASAPEAESKPFRLPKITVAKTADAETRQIGRWANNVLQGFGLIHTWAIREKILYSGLNSQRVIDHFDRYNDAFITAIGAFSHAVTSSSLRDLSSKEINDLAAALGVSRVGSKNRSEVIHIEKRGEALLIHKVFNTTRHDLINKLHFGPLSFARSVGLQGSALDEQVELFKENNNFAAVQVLIENLPNELHQRYELEEMTIGTIMKSVSSAITGWNDLHDKSFTAGVEVGPIDETKTVAWSQLEIMRLVDNIASNIVKQYGERDGRFPGEMDDPRVLKGSLREEEIGGTQYFALEFQDEATGFSDGSNGRPNLVGINPFQHGLSVRQYGEGEGRGLAGCQERLIQMGGFVETENYPLPGNPGRFGGKLTVYLPFSSASIEE